LYILAPSTYARGAVAQLDGRRGRRDPQGLPGLLSASPVWLVLSTFEDLWGREPKNVPAAGGERGNWRRQTRYAREVFSQLAGVRGLLTMMSELSSRHWPKRLTERDATTDRLKPLPPSHRSSPSMGSACPARPRYGVQLAVLESSLLSGLLGEPLCDQTHRSTPSGPHPRRQPDRCRAALAGAPGSEAPRPRGDDRSRGQPYR